MLIKAVQGMIQAFEINDKITFTKVVTTQDVASFESGNVHDVYSTFALTRDAEWACRQFVLKMKEAHEEGIGTFVEVHHVSPALVGQQVIFTAKLDDINHHEIICSFEATVGERVVAYGKTRQKILLLTKLKQLFEKINNE